MFEAIIQGRLGKDPEMRYTPNGTAVLNFSNHDRRKDRRLRYRGQVGCRSPYSSSNNASESASGRWTGRSWPAPETILRATRFVK